MASDSIASITSLVSTRSGKSSEISVSRIREVDAATTERQNTATIDHLGRMTQARAAAAEQSQVSREAFEKVVSELQAYVQNTRRNLDFHVDDQSGRVVVKVIDARSDEVIRQIPSEEMLDLARRIQDFLEQNQPEIRGMFLELKA